MISHQTFKQWQQSPIQGAVPNTTPDLSDVQDALLTALGDLRVAHHFLESTGLSKQYSTLFTAVSDALNATSEAIDHTEDAPDA